MRALLAVLALVVGTGGAVVIYGIAHHDPKPTGYRDPVTLAVSVRDSWDEQNKPSRIHDVSCIVKTKTTALCIGKIRSHDFDNGDQTTLDITIAKDGDSWISE